MVSLCSDFNELSFLPADPYSARITAFFKTYGAEHGFALFWVQREGDVPMAAISRVDGNMTLCAFENADFEELACFMNAAGFSSLTCSEENMKNLGFEMSKSSFTVKYSGDFQPTKAGISRDCDKRQIYDLLCRCGFELGSYGSFLADVCARLNKGTASMASVEENGAVQACAFALFEGEKSVLLGAVATSPEARGRGYASKLVGFLAQEKCGKEVFLFCRNDGLADFYAKIGFETVGRWAICERRM